MAALSPVGKSIPLQYRLSDFYVSKELIEKKHPEGIKRMEALAAQGNFDALNYLDAHYYNSRDYVNSFAYNQKSAAHGKEDALFRLAYKYKTGKGVKQDFREAIRIYEKIGTGDAFYLMGSIFECDLEQEGEAIACYLKGADLDNSFCQYALYQCMKEKDPISARRYLEMAAEDLSEAQYDLAEMYYDAKEYEQAALFLELAISDDHEGAVSLLLTIYSQGHVKVEATKIEDLKALFNKIHGKEKHVPDFEEMSLSKRVKLKIEKDQLAEWDFPVGHPNYEFKHES